MSEFSAYFGADRHLAGTLCLPAGQPLRLGVIMLNAGVIHRIGPHRINVRLARSLAKAGIASLRFDLSGVGDSGRPKAPRAYREQAVIDLRAAIDHLERATAANRVAIVGICSGAENGLMAAVQDPRVAGLWMHDGFTFPSWKTPLYYYLHRARRMSVGDLLRSAMGMFRFGARKATIRVEPNSESPTVGSQTGRPTPGQFASWLQQLCDRGVSVRMLQSGSMISAYSYQDQFRDVFGALPFAKQVACTFRPDVDHTLTAIGAQEEFIAMVVAWCSEVAPT
jgi:pimeloyl-ACP methyl ester carboxylesterase